MSLLNDVRRQRLLIWIVAASALLIIIGSRCYTIHRLHRLAF